MLFLHAERQRAVSPAREGSTQELLDNAFLYNWGNLLCNTSADSRHDERASSLEVLQVTQDTAEPAGDFKYRILPLVVGAYLIAAGTRPGR